MAARFSATAEYGVARERAERLAYDPNEPAPHPEWKVRGRLAVMLWLERHRSRQGERL